MITKNIDWDDIFKKATNDITSYIHTLKEWNTDNTDIFDLFIEITYRRHRLFDAKALIEDAPEDYKEYKDTLFSLIEDGEKQFKNIIEKDERFKNAFNKTTEYLNTLDKTLNDVYNAHTNIIVFYPEDDEESDIEELNDELFESGTDFLEMFLRIKCIYDQLNDFKSIDKDTLERYQTHFLEIEKKFKTLFYLFKPLENVIKNYMEDAYQPERFWWFVTPVPEYSPDDKIVPLLVKKALSRLSEIPKESCPEPQKIAAYAYNELGYSERKSLESHIFSCLNCLREVILLRHIIATNPIPSYEEIEAMEHIYVPQDLMEKALSLSKKKLPDFKSLIDRYIVEPSAEAIEKIRDFLNDMFPGEVALSYATRGEQQISIGKTTWIIRKKIAKPFIIIDKPEQEENPDMKTVAGFLLSMQKYLPVYYCLYGMGLKKPLTLIMQSTSQKLPIEIQTESLEGVNALFFIVFHKKEDMERFSNEMEENIKKQDLPIPSIKPILWIILYIEP